MASKIQACRDVEALLECSNARMATRPRRGLQAAFRRQRDRGLLEQNGELYSLTRLGERRLHDLLVCAIGPANLAVTEYRDLPPHVRMHPTMFGEKR